MAAKATQSESGGPLSPEHLRELALAQERGAKIRKAASVANFNGWITAVIAAGSAMFLLLSFTFVALLLTAGLAFVAFNEFRGRDRLNAFDPSAATLLGWNQAGLLAMITLYCLWMMFASWTADTSSLTKELGSSPDTRELLGDVKQLEGAVRVAMVGFYALIIALTVVFQGLNSLYYFSRKKYVESYNRETPAWIRDVQRTTSRG